MGQQRNTKAGGSHGRNEGKEGQVEVMAGMKEIQTRMKSIQDTMKITNAMYMISYSKLKQSRKRLEATEPYFYTCRIP